MTLDAMASLRQSAFFEEFRPRHMEKLLALGSEVLFAKDEVIFREDEESRLFYVILSGRVALEANIGGRIRRIQTLFANDELGWSAMLSRRRHFQARALEPVRAMAFEGEALREACRDDPYFGCAFLERMFTVVAERLQSTRIQLAAALADAKSSAADANEPPAEG